MMLRTAGIEVEVFESATYLMLLIINVDEENVE